MNDLYLMIVYATIIILSAIITLIAFDTWQTVLCTSLLLILIMYVIILSVDRLTDINTLDTDAFITALTTSSTKTEGFEDKKESEANTSKYEWLTNADLFDDFYAGVFTKLTQNEALIQAETAICLEEFSKTTLKNHISVLDVGCGIGIGTCSFVNLGVGNAVGVDKSQAMIRYAKEKTLPHTTLTDTQKQDVEFRNFDLNMIGACGEGEFTDACVLYFSVYYFKDLDVLFRNLAHWVKPGGNLAIEVVNKYKFEPVLDSSNPFVGVSPQRYTKERITKSKVVFDKFDYEAVFDLEDPNAEFRETFRFKDGSVRRQKHTLYMPSMEDMIAKAQRNGWTYTQYSDLMPLSFQYGYLLFFKRTLA
jgi:SAM-dependent methyltransferase